MFGKPRARTPSALTLIPRVVRFDYESVLRQNRYWHGGDPVVTHFFNALQAMFPEGERFFMDSARDVRDMLGKDNIPAELRGFANAMHQAVHVRLRQRGRDLFQIPL